MFYSDLLYQAFLPALSMLPTCKCLDAKHGKCKKHHKCSCLKMSKILNKNEHHHKDIKQKWDLRSSWDRDIEQERLLWETLDVTPPTLTTAIHQIDVTKDRFLEVLNQVSLTTSCATLTSLTD